MLFLFLRKVRIPLQALHLYFVMYEVRVVRDVTFAASLVEQFRIVEKCDSVD
jgi:hypothetical protein